MQKRRKALALSVGVLALAATGFGQGMRSSIFLNGAAFFPNNDAIQNKVGQGFGVALRFQNHLTFSFEWKYAKLKVNPKEGGLMNGEISYTPLVLNVAYHPMPEARFSPYGFLGGGFYLIQLRPGARLTPEEADIKTQQVKNGFGLSGGIGAAVRIAPRLFLYVEGLYLWRKANVETLFFDNRPVESFTSDFSSFSALIGLKTAY
ncbi:MAG TPA: outer membrane beta-barrel protein [Candidatus Desulfaltia sp.]|nr:outer membrane beta-barrel protein [Candidatus Desulfaltia sp.]